MIIMLKEAVVADFKGLSQNFLKETDDSIKELSFDRMFTNQDSNSNPSESGLYKHVTS
jgi:hypothetical protein